MMYEYGMGIGQLQGAASRSKYGVYINRISVKPFEQTKSASELNDYTASHVTIFQVTWSLMKQHLAPQSSRSSQLSSQGLIS